MGATSGAGITYPSDVPEFVTGFCGFRVAQSLVFCVLILFYYSFSFCPFYVGHCIVCPSISFSDYPLIS